VLSAPSFEDENPEQYDLVLMNPPFHSGKEVNYNLPAHLIQRAHKALPRGGRLTLVANRFIRYERQMRRIFRRAEIIAHTGKFHIIRGTK
jgi:16S rRNA G1207 methylase RsmC